MESHFTKFNARQSYRLCGISVVTAHVHACNNHCTIFVKLQAFGFLTAFALIGLIISSFVSRKGKVLLDVT